MGDGRGGFEVETDSEREASRADPNNRSVRNTKSVFSNTVR